MTTSPSTLHVRPLGGGPPVALLRSNPSPAGDRMPAAERPAARFRVLVPASPGCGQSPAIGEASIEANDQPLADVLRARGAGELHAIVGSSSGAYRAFEMVLRGRCRADVIIGPGALADFHGPARRLRRGLDGTAQAIERELAR